MPGKNECQERANQYAVSSCIRRITEHIEACKKEKRAECVVASPCAWAHLDPHESSAATEYVCDEATQRRIWMFMKNAYPGAVFRSFQDTAAPGSGMNVRFRYVDDQTKK